MASGAGAQIGSLERAVCSAGQEVSGPAVAAGTCAVDVGAAAHHNPYAAGRDLGVGRDHDGADVQAPPA